MMLTDDSRLSEIDGIADRMDESLRLIATAADCHCGWMTGVLTVEYERRRGHTVVTES